jgi:hypothetical protein
MISKCSSPANIIFQPIFAIVIYLSIYYAFCIQLYIVHSSSNSNKQHQLCLIKKKQHFCKHQLESGKWFYSAANMVVFGFF